MSHPKLINRIGERYGMLTVVERAGNTSWGNAKWLCKCDCGELRIVQGGNLRSGNSTNCGCIGIVAATERIKKIAIANVGACNPAWKGGLTPINLKIRNSKEYAIWREAVFKRDDYTCQECGARSGEGKAVVLNADHIKPFAWFPELRLAIDNGLTLCVSCHRKTPTFAGRSKKPI